MSKPAVDPRIAPKEMIVTRYKSAQQKMHLREKDRSMTKITELLKSPTNKTSKVKKRMKKNPANVKKVSSQKSPDGEYVEYYPDKLRRRFEQKRVFLKPKYESKTVVKLNKRKLGTPQRGFCSEGINSLPNKTEDNQRVPKNQRKAEAKSPVFSELSMEEVVRIVEETESLDDEDLMEILTCPSPVWWEEPPDEKYIEEAIFTRKVEESRNQAKRPRKQRSKGITNIPPVTEQKISTITENIEIGKKDDKFLMKRNKLENLLGNIKNKSFNNNDNGNVKDKEKKTRRETNRKKPEHPRKCQIRKEKRQAERNESSDLNFIDEQLLKDLENIVVPIEKLKKVQSLEVNVVKEEIKEELPKDSSSDCNKAIDEPQVPINLPPLIKRPELDNQSPSIKSVSEYTDGSSISGRNNDSISDTNVKFITDDDEATDTKAKQEVDELERDNAGDKSDILKDISEKKDFITVYKIVSSENDKSLVNKLKNTPEYSNYVDKLANQEPLEDTSKYHGQLNAFFKKCKNVNRKKKTAEKLANNDIDSQLCGSCEYKKSSIDIAQEENVKYCLKCSSIFDTDECSYCLNSKTDEKDLEKLKTDLT